VIHLILAYNKHYRYDVPELVLALIVIQLDDLVLLSCIEFCHM
jgi:hypothetical protein